MKIAYIIDPQVVVSNKSNGIRNQAESWALILQKVGHQVDLISNWGNYDWKTYDAIHFFGIGNWCTTLARRMSELNNRLINSPIFDYSPDMGSRISNLVRKNVGKFTHGVVKTHAYNQYVNYNLFPRICVRSKFEKQYIQNNYEIPENRFALVPLSYSPACKPFVTDAKEKICLHISSIYQDRKNVVRLIEAAKKYNFNLVLAGNKGTEFQFAPLRNVIGDCTNIEVLGFISEEQKIDLYKRAKVFALPSISEGVGIVALDAAYYGCEIVITDIEGPKEYYKGQCIEVNPFNVDEIGRGIMSFINEERHFQPGLSDFVNTTYSPQAICALLEKMYMDLVPRK